MNYNEAMEYIHGMMKFGSNLGLERIGKLLELMENPQKKLKFVHVAGTNGKGSAVTFISNILIEAGYRVGIYTSPCIHRFSERIRINSSEISENDIARITDTVKEKVNLLLECVSDCPTEFEIVTAIALQYFYEQNCNIVVLEVGLGGRLDSTNIIDTPEVAVITTINYDHMEVLGDTLAEIAFEKAGIIKEKGDVVLYPQNPEVEGVFEKVCEKRNASLHKVDFSRLSAVRFDMISQVFDYEEYKSLVISLIGNHQIRNAAVAVKTIEILRNKGYKIGEEAIRAGLVKAKWPARFEVVNNNPLFIVDGAHNIEGSKALSDNLQRYFPNTKITFIVGVLADKDYKPMMEYVVPLASRFITITPKSPRALKADDLAGFLRTYNTEVIICDKVEEAVRISIELLSKDDIICAFGSLYYIGEVREYFGLS